MNLFHELERLGIKEVKNLLLLLCRIRYLNDNSDLINHESFLNLSINFVFIINGIINFFFLVPRWV